MRISCMSMILKCITIFDSVGSARRTEFCKCRHGARSGFSAGGFAPKYGDKMASVLDVTYNRPNAFRSSETSLLGGSLMAQDVGLNHRLAWSVGIRHKNSQYLLGSTNTNGQYSPSFTDVQYYVSALLQPKWRLEWIGQYAKNRFYFVPTERVTDFGLFNQQIGSKSIIRVKKMIDIKRDEWACFNL